MRDSSLWKPVNGSPVVARILELGPDTLRYASIINEDKGPLDEAQERAVDKLFASRLVKTVALEAILEQPKYAKA
jgi:hypothetical protein